MKHILAVVVFLMLVSCTSHEGSVTEALSHPMDFDAVYSLDGLSYNLIAIKDGKLYQLKHGSVMHDGVTEIFLLRPESEDRPLKMIKVQE